MTREVINHIADAETRLKVSGVSQKIKSLEFRMPNDLRLNGIFQAELVKADETGAVDLLLQSHGEPFTASASRSMLLSDQVRLAPGQIRTAFGKLIDRLNTSSSYQGPVSVGRTRY